MRSHFVMVAYGRSGRWAVRAKWAAAGGSTRRISMKDFFTRFFKTFENNVQETIVGRWAVRAKRAAVGGSTQQNLMKDFSPGFSNLLKTIFLKKLL